MDLCGSHLMGRALDVATGSKNLMLYPKVYGLGILCADHTCGWGIFCSLKGDCIGDYYRGY